MRILQWNINVLQNIQIFIMRQKQGNTITKKKK